VTTAGRAASASERRRNPVGYAPTLGWRGLDDGTRWRSRLLDRQGGDSRCLSSERQRASSKPGGLLAAVVGLRGLDDGTRWHLLDQQCHPLVEQRASSKPGG